MRVINAVIESFNTHKPVQIAPLARDRWPTREQVMKLDAVSPGKMYHAARPDGSGDSQAER